MIIKPIRYLSRLFGKKQQMDHDKQNENRRLFLVLKSGRMRLWFYEVSMHHYTYLAESEEDRKEYNPVEFSQFYHHDDFDPMRRTIFNIAEGKQPSAVVPLRSSQQDDGAFRHYMVNLSVASRDDKGNVTRILGIEQDVTEDVLRKEEVNKLLMRYHTVFNSSLLDTVYYDKDGVMRDINEKACQTFGIKDRELLKHTQFKLEKNPMFNAIPLQDLENTRTSSIINFDDYTDPAYRIQELGLTGKKMYYESTINPIRSADGQLEGVYMAGREITEMVESYHLQVAVAKRLQQALNDIQQYIRSINYALRVSDVRLVSYNPRTYTLELSNNVNEKQMRLSQLRCIRVATPRFRRAVSSALNRMDHLTTHQIGLTIETEFHDERYRPIWMMFNLVPLLDANGQVERYFGMCREMTDMIETERRLALETKKAQETELLKQSFLTNMSYEIRTPLNTVVGFAELLEHDHDPADEPLFVEHIKKSSSNLLELINDILFLSRLDANMIACNRSETDFALIFESHCQMGWSCLRPGVKTVVENPYTHLIVDIDQTNLGKVIEMLCANAAFFTHEGMIRAWYVYRRGELTISVEDTGIGIDEKTLPHVFDRFVRDEHEEMCGTGLNLPIVQSLVHLMGGTIEFQSQLGKGTTVWVSIPCEMKSLEKNGEITPDMKQYESITS